MENKLYIGIDNGVTGTIGCIYNNKTWFFETPVKTEQNYTKAKANISRIILPKLLNELNKIIFDDIKPGKDKKILKIRYEREKFLEQLKTIKKKGVTHDTNKKA